MCSRTGATRRRSSPTTQRSVHPELNPHGTTRECMNLTPIVVAMDVTRSRGDDSRVIYAKLPMFIGQIELRNYVPGPGDQLRGDRRRDLRGSRAAAGRPVRGRQPPRRGALQDLARGRRRRLGPGVLRARGLLLRSPHEAGGGRARGEKGFFFFLGDEGFYPQVDLAQVRSILGHEAPEGARAGRSAASPSPARAPSTRPRSSPSCSRSFTPS
jgi:hypothetical protein